MATPVKSGESHSQNFLFMDQVWRIDLPKGTTTYFSVYVGAIELVLYDDKKSMLRKAFLAYAKYQGQKTGKKVEINKA